MCVYVYSCMYVCISVCICNYVYIYILFLKIYTMEALFFKGTDDGVFRLFTGEYTGFPVYSPVNIQEILLRHETANFKKKFIT